MTIPYLAEIAKAHEERQEQQLPGYSQVLPAESSTASLTVGTNSAITPTTPPPRTTPPHTPPPPNQFIPSPCQSSPPPVTPTTLSTDSTAHGGHHYNRDDYDLPPAYSLLDEHAGNSVGIGHPPQGSWQSDVKVAITEPDTSGEIGEPFAGAECRLPSQATISGTDIPQQYAFTPPN